MNIILAGKTNSGKGTQARFLTEKLKIPHVSVGELLRNARNDPKYGKQIREAQDTGVLVSNKLTFEIVEKRLKRCKSGFLLDGFPRDEEQALFLKKNFRIDHAVKLNVDDALILKRLASRLECKKCGQIFGIDFPPKKKGICDKCGGELYKRKDDTKTEAIKKRLAIYRNETEPLFKKYFKEVLHEIDGAQKPDKVLKIILKALGK